MNWGLRLVILYVAFMALILVLVFKSMNEKVDLVTENYYQEELKFQNRIDRQNQSAALNEQPLVHVTAENVEIKFPGSLSKEKISGTVKFYRPSDASKDFTTPLQVDSSGTQIVPSGKFEKGIYQVQFTWETQGKNFYNEVPLYIP
ncbi:MAG TPA: FixH family protein [Bacteroidia bacterium]|nr:FixH family protein [Bacteroidia bacterium]